MYAHAHIHTYTQTNTHTHTHIGICILWQMDRYGVASVGRLLKIIGSFAKEPYKRDDILQKRPIILRHLLIVATP